MPLRVRRRPVRRRRGKGARACGSVVVGVPKVVGAVATLLGVVTFVGEISVKPVVVAIFTAMRLTFAPAANRLNGPFSDAGALDVVPVIKEGVMLFGRAERSAAAQLA